MVTTKGNIFKQLSSVVANGILSGSMPWQLDGIPPLVVKDDRLISGINYLLLSQAAYADPRWCVETEANKRGWSVKSGEDERYAVFAMKSKSSEGGADRQLVGAKMFNYSQLNGPDVYVLPENSSIETAKVLISIILNSGDNILVSNRMTYENNVFHVKAPDLENIDEWNSSALAALASYGHRYSDARSNGHDSFIVNLAHTMLCAEYGVPLPLEKNRIKSEDQWLETIKSDEKYVFRASKAASLICDHVSQLSPASLLDKNIINSKFEDTNFSLFENDNSEKANNNNSDVKVDLLNAISERLKSIGLDDFAEEFVDAISISKSNQTKI